MSAAGYVADAAGIPEAQREAAKRERALLDACRAYAQADAALQARWRAHEAGGEGDGERAESFALVQGAGGERAAALEAMAKAAIAAYGPPAEAPPTDAERAALDAGRAFAAAMGAVDEAEAEARRMGANAAYGALVDARKASREAGAELGRRMRAAYG